MQSRVMNSVSRQLSRGFAFNKSYTYFRTPVENLYQRATLVPGIFIGPEITGAVVECFKACNVPVDFDIISDFNIETPDAVEKLKKNKVLLVGNLGKAGSRYLDNTKCYKALDLPVHSKIPSRSGPREHVAEREDSPQQCRHRRDQRKPRRRVLRHRARSLPRRL